MSPTGISIYRSICFLAVAEAEEAAISNAVKRRNDQRAWRLSLFRQNRSPILEAGGVMLANRRMHRSHDGPDWKSAACSLQLSGKARMSRSERSPV